MYMAQTFIYIPTPILGQNDRGKIVTRAVGEPAQWAGRRRPPPLQNFKGCGLGGPPDG